MNELIVEGFDEEDFVDLHYILQNFTSIPVKDANYILRAVHLVGKVEKIIDALKSQDEEVQRDSA